MTLLPYDDDFGLLCDNFAGGGSASAAIEAALGRAIDFAVNQDEEAIRMHKVNHPGTVHIRNNIWQVDLYDIAKRHRVRFARFSAATFSQLFKIGRHHEDRAVFYQIAVLEFQRNAISELLLMVRRRFDQRFFVGALCAEDIFQGFFSHQSLHLHAIDINQNGHRASFEVVRNLTRNEMRHV